MEQRSKPTPVNDFKNEGTEGIQVFLMNAAIQTLSQHNNPDGDKEDSLHEQQQLHINSG